MNMTFPNDGHATALTSRFASVRLFVWAFIAIGLVGQWMIGPTEAIAFQRRANQPPARTEFGFDPEDTTPIADRDPFDKIILTDGQYDYTLAVKPLNLPKPIDYKQAGELRFEMLDRAERVLQCPWARVKQILTFDDILVAETKIAYEKGNLDRAWRNLIYFNDTRGAKDPLVLELMDQFLYRDGAQLIRDGNYELAVTVLEELYDRNPEFVGAGTPLTELLATEYDRRIAAMAKNVEIDRIKAGLESLQAKYARMPSPIAGVVTKWIAEVDRQGQLFLDSSEPIARGDDLVSAHSSARRAVYRLPKEQRSWTMYEEVFSRLPVVLVGVTELADKPDIRAAENWSARRVGSMLQKQLVDLVGLGDEGGRYEFADGRIMPLDEFGMSYRLEILRESISGKPSMNSMELAQRLASLVREDSSEFYFPLAKIVESISIVDDTKVDIRLRQPFARFESLLRVPYQATKSDRGVYSQQKSSKDTQFFNPANDESSQARLPIVELRFPTSAHAADALLTGEIDVLDRVSPADLQRLRSNEAISVRPYLIPSVHLLIPNQRTRFMKDQVYRRSLLYAVDRQRIVDQIICGDQVIPGNSVISGPLPTGSDENDLIGYGYNEHVQLVGFNVAMGVISPMTVLGQMRKEARKLLLQDRKIELDGIGVNESDTMINAWLDEDKSIREPKLIVVHPDTEIATVTCQAMQQMWIAAGRDVELRPLPPGVTRPADDAYDLLYAEFTIEEPLVDIRRVLGELGLAKQISPTIGQLIWELDTARNWVQSRQILRQIHEQCSAEVTVLPLWQTINFYAFRKNVHGLGESQVRLYDNVDRWTIERRTKE